MTQHAQHTCNRLTKGVELGDIYEPDTNVHINIDEMFRTPPLLYALAWRICDGYVTKAPSMGVHYILGESWLHVLHGGL